VNLELLEVPLKLDNDSFTKFLLGDFENEYEGLALLVAFMACDILVSVR